MGKYILSGGEVGVWEAFRPLIHPIIIGTFWKINLSPIFVGKSLDLIFSLIAIYLTYLVGLKIFNKKVAIISSLLLSLMPVFVMFTGLILTEPLAIVFGLLGIYFFIRKDNLTHLFFAGIFLSLSFLTKFPQGIFFGAVFIILLFKKEKFKRKTRNLITMVAGFIIPATPYFIFNYYTYPNMFEPFISGSWIVTTATWLYGSGITYYFTHFFLVNPIYLFFFGYIYIFFKEKHYKNQSAFVIFLITILTILYFIYVPRKEVRYLVTIIPLLAILVSYTLVKVYYYLKKADKPAIRPRSFIIICTILVLIFIPSLLHFDLQPELRNREIKEIIERYNVAGSILSSNPIFISLVDNDIVLLSGMDYAKAIYERERDNFELLLINNCDLPCNPNDSVCINEREELFNEIKTENKEIFKKTFILRKKLHECTYIMYIPKE